MSLDNVIAIAAVAERFEAPHSYALLMFGLAVSIPLIMAGAALVMALLERFPIVVWAGAALLGWIAGEIIAKDPLFTGQSRSGGGAYGMDDRRHAGRVVRGRRRPGAPTLDAAKRARPDLALSLLSARALQGVRLGMRIGRHRTCRPLAAVGPPATWSATKAPRSPDRLRVPRVVSCAGLQFELGVDLGAEQHDVERDIKPEQQHDHRAERAVDPVVIGEVRHIVREARRSDEPHDGGEYRARRVTQRHLAFRRQGP